MVKQQAVPKLSTKKQEARGVHPSVANGDLLELPGRPYYVHSCTDNASFLKMSAELAAAGVKNHRFMLALYDPELARVDPLSEELDDEMRSRVLREMTQNPWYFFRQVVRIPVPGALSRFELHKGNLYLLWCMVANLNCFLILPRQTYKTLSACSFYLWAYCFGAKNSHILFFNKEHTDSKNNLKRLKDLMQELPEWIRKPILTHQQDLNAIEYITSKARGNKIDAKPAGTNVEAADKLGRGATVPHIWYDEGAFMKYFETTFMAAAPASSRAAELAAANGTSYGTCITTTPNNLDLPEAEFAYRIKTGALQFRPEFYDLGPIKVKEIMDRESEIPFLFAEFTWKDLGKTEAWYRTQCRALLNDRAKIKREIDLIWPLSGEGSVFEEEQLDNLRNYLVVKPAALMPVKPPGGGAPPGLFIEWVEPPDVGRAYVIGLDSAAGEGTGDYTAFVWHDPEDMRAVAHMRTRTTDTEALREVVEHIFCGLFPNSVAVVERNYLGIAFLRYMEKKLGMGARIFYIDKIKLAERKVGPGRTLALRRPVRELGVQTDVGNREAMIRHLFQIVDELPHLFPVGAIQDEIRTLQRKKNGKIEHRSGFHDDVLFSSLICHFADRYDGGVLRRMIATNQTGSRLRGATAIATLNQREGNREALLNPSESQAAVMPRERAEPFKERETTVSSLDYVRNVDERIERENSDPVLKRRREMRDLIVGLNRGFTPRGEDR